MTDPHAYPNKRGFILRWSDSGTSTNERTDNCRGHTESRRDSCSPERGRHQKTDQRNRSKGEQVDEHLQP